MIYRMGLRHVGNWGGGEAIWCFAGCRPQDTRSWVFVRMLQDFATGSTGAALKILFILFILSKKYSGGGRERGSNLCFNDALSGLCVVSDFSRGVAPGSMDDAPLGLGRMLAE